MKWKPENQVTIFDVLDSSVDGKSETKEVKKLRFLDLFAGIGGFRLGMEMAGHECVGFVEWDKYARKSYEAMHNTEGEWTAHDITTITDDDIRLLGGKGIDVICGGFPCQAFSVAGKRGGFNDTRGTLFFEIARIAKQIKPRYLFLENVKGLLSHDQGRTFGTILNTLDELGYDAEWQVLNSKNFGVPQNRERVFIIGHLRGSGGREIFPISSANGESSVPIKIVAHRERFRRSFQTFSPDGITESLDTGQGGGRGHYTIIPDGRRGVVIDHGKIRETTDNISTCLPATYYKGLDNHGARTGVQEEMRIRKLTPKECFRLQGFPDEKFHLAESVNSNSQLYKQAGNSVTVNVIREIAKHLN